MRDNTERAQDGQEIYTHKIKSLADDYINTLDNPEDIYNNKNNLFDGMIKYIYLYYFKNNPVDYDNTDELNNIWDIYTMLCYKYNRNPIIIEFSGMINIHRDTLNSWKNENTRAFKYYTVAGERIYNLPGWKLNHPNEEYRQEPSTTHSDMVKKWQEECEKVQYRGATEKFSTGSIFVLKADYGYTETAPVPVQNPHQIASRTPEEIAAGYGKLSENETQFTLPEPPE